MINSLPMAHRTIQEIQKAVWDSMIATEDGNTFVELSRTFDTLTKVLQFTENRVRNAQAR